jgi:hypothetical protein|tara:strand:+ start:283 stop:546 length:264 start_codon:yes stop_codon:yes gene_type:complete
MSIQDIYEAAGLTQPEIDAIDRCLDSDCQDSEVEQSGFSKLQHHFCETEEMPYAIATQSVWHPDNTATPDEWIVEHLQMCNTAPAVV